MAVLNSNGFFAYLPGKAKKSSRNLEKKGPPKNDP